ncbi:MAG: hypothetical protein HYW04_03260 [Deltaproteobacteria bacterium]|nr:hypothetical protein [Deltaproteobacteria bacterium]
MGNGVYDVLIMRLFFAALLVSSVLFFSPASAQDENPFQQWFKEHVKGTLLYKNFAHFHTTEAEQRTVRQEGIVRLEVDQTFQENWRFFLVPQWKADTANYTAGAFQDFRDTTLRDPYFYLREGYVKYRGDNYDATVGKQFYSWGTADGFNPTDNLNPRDYHDVPDREKIGIFSFAATYYPPDASITLVVVPFFTPSRLPMAHSRWSPTPNSKTSEDTSFGALGIPEGTTGKRREMPGKRLDKVQVGLRAKQTIAGWDVSASYFSGYNTQPVVRVVDTVARPRFNRMHVIGADFTTTSGKFEYHGEWAARLYESGRATSILPILLGGMYTMDYDWVKDLGLEHILWNLEYVREVTLRKKFNDQYRESGIFDRPFQNAVLTRLTFKIDENNELYMSVNWNIHYHRTDHHHDNWFVQPKFMHKFSDSLKVEGGWELFWGANNSFWGKWKRNDRTFAKFTYLF